MLNTLVRIIMTVCYPATVREQTEIVTLAICCTTKLCIECNQSVLYKYHNPA